jgi:hypothetical protein
MRKTTRSEVTSRAAKWVTAIVLLTIGIGTATAITKSPPAAPGFSWSQSSNFVKSPFLGGFETALY